MANRPRPAVSGTGRLGHPPGGAGVRASGRGCRIVPITACLRPWTWPVTGSHTNVKPQTLIFVGYSGNRTNKGGVERVQGERRRRIKH